MVGLHTWRDVTSLGMERLVYCGEVAGEPTGGGEAGAEAEPTGGGGESAEVDVCCSFTIFRSLYNV